MTEDFSHSADDLPERDGEIGVAAIQRQLAAIQRTHICRRHFSEECRCESFANWVVGQAQRLLADDRAEVRRYGERLLLSVLEGLAGRRLATDTDIR